MTYSPFCSLRCLHIGWQAEIFPWTLAEYRAMVAEEKALAREPRRRPNIVEQLALRIRNRSTIFDDNAV